eukprot:Nitzschia sp. Nitz4//scaffold110_size71422//817//1740//NITZ4_005861-RA/size71422-processed-gene-0.66-mRNA-1//-1//CDS//3329533050//7226//frame0
MNSLSMNNMNQTTGSMNNQDGLQDEISRVLGILDCAEEVITSSDFSNDAVTPSLLSLEPTPIGPQGIQSVFPPQFSYSQMLSMGQCNDGGYSDDFSPIDCSQVRPNKRQCLSMPPKTDSLVNQMLPFKMFPEENQDFMLANTKNTQEEEQPHPARFRKYQCDQWMERFQDLIEFKKETGHCLVPHNFPPNQQLAQWTKRQRYQYKLKQMNRHSTLTDARQQELEEMGFVWDSHKAAWFERLEDLKQYRLQHGHCNVPSNYEDRPLAIWVKCQRRQMKLFTRGQKSTMNAERINALDVLGFDWNPRNL